MAVSKITVTFHTDFTTTIEPENYAEGIYEDGEIEAFSDVSTTTGVGLSLFSEDQEFLASYSFPVGEKTAMEVAYPAYLPLAGKYIRLSNDTDLVPILPKITEVGSPENVTLSGTLSREAVELSWLAGSAGTGNSVTGYDVQYRDSADGATYGDWAAASGSPVTGLGIAVSPPETVGHYRQFRVRTRGSAGSSYYSGWVTLSTPLRRKWDAFSAWTEPEMTARVTHIRAALITEIREHVNVIRAFYGLADAGFTEIVAGKTGIAKWAALIQEIRDAVDEITLDHEAWNLLEAGRPRIMHVAQLRRIIDEM